MLTSISSVGALSATVQQPVLPPLRDRVLQLTRQAGIEPDERQLTGLTDTAAWMACVWRNTTSGWRETVDIVDANDELSLARAPATWHVTGAADAIAKLLGLSARNSYDDPVHELARRLEWVVRNNLGETWAELEREQHPVTRVDRHSAVRDWPDSIQRLALPMHSLVGADLSVGAAQNADLLVGFDLSGVSLEKANLSGMNLDTAKLRGTYLWRADMSATKLRGADLGGANLTFANMRSADLSGAVLDGVSAMATDFTGAVLDGARLSLSPTLLADLAEEPVDLCKAILQAVDTVSDDYRALKRDLVASVADALARAPDSVNARRNAHLVRSYMAARSIMFGSRMAR